MHSTVNEHAPSSQGSVSDGVNAECGEELRKVGGILDRVTSSEVEDLAQLRGEVNSCWNTPPGHWDKEETNSAE